jgi:hypothetical protein
MPHQQPRGRPTEHDSYSLQNVLVYCETIREQALMAKGRLLSDRELIRRVCKQGGYPSFVAGPTELIAERIATGELKEKWFPYDGNGPTSPNKARIYVTKHIRDEDYLRQLFMKAQRQLDAEEAMQVPNIRGYIGDLVRARLGLPSTGTALERPKRRKPH